MVCRRVGRVVVVFDCIRVGGCVLVGDVMRMSDVHVERRRNHDGRVRVYTTEAGCRRLSGLSVGSEEQGASHGVSARFRGLRTCSLELRTAGGWSAVLSECFCCLRHRLRMVEGGADSIR